MTNESQNYQEAYEAALGAISNEKPEWRQVTFENLNASELVSVNELDADEETAQEAIDDLKRNFNKHMFCVRCRSEIVFHGDSSFHCACDSINEDDTEIPAHWTLTEDERAEKVQAEKEYSDNE